MPEFIHRSRIEAPAEAVFAWHEREGAFDRLNPPWENVRVVERSGGIRDGARVVLRIGAGPAGFHWVLEHRDYRQGRQFRDVQVRGPFRRWEHTHLFLPEGDRACILEDRIVYEAPFGRLGRAVAEPLMRARLKKLFRYRHRVTKRDLEGRIGRGDLEGSETMKVAITGSHGLLGSALTSYLSTRGDEVHAMVRRREQVRDGEIYWNAEEGTVDTGKLAGLDVVVHLAGENIAALRWTDEKKSKIMGSREKGTGVLAEALAGMDDAARPKVLVCASAMGYYGDRGEEVLTEHSSSGRGFLAEVCRRWEAAADPARAAGMRVVHTRMGIVLSPKGGALKTMLPAFQLGLGGRLGDGRQWMSWVSLEDVPPAIVHVIEHGEISGPVNVVAPNIVRNSEFTKTLGHVLGRPTIFFVPAPAAKLAIGEMADEMLLSSYRMDPAVLETSGFQWKHPQLEQALRELLGKG